MAVTRVQGRTLQYFGLSSDTKPLLIGGNTPIDTGSTFFETDTGNWFIFDSVAWNRSSQSIQSGVAQIGGVTVLASATLARPNNTTAYASGQLVANSVTAGSVVPLTLTLGRTASGAGATGLLRRLKLRKSGTSLTNAQFRVHLYRVSPVTITNGDGGAWSTSGVADYVNSFTVTLDKAFTDGASGFAGPDVGTEIVFTQQTYYALIEARAAYTPVANEVFVVECESLQN